MRMQLRTLLELVAVLTAIAVVGPARADAPPAPFPSETEAALQSILDKHQARNGAPGILVGVWAPGRGSFVRAQGVGDITAAVPLREADAVRIGSITKTFVATVVLQLADEGRLSLDDRLESYVPGIANGERITIRQLLGMTSGVANFLDDPEFLAAYARDPRMPFAPAAALDIARQHAPRFGPGDGFDYSETNYFLLGLIVEQVTGISVGEAIDRRIVQPLGLSGTALPRTASMPELSSRGYQPTAGGDIEDVTEQNPDVTWTAGAMVSTLEDLHAWVRALATGALLSPEMQHERLRWTAVPGGEPLDARYGLGIFSLAGFLGHNGSIPGYSSIAVYLPETDTSMVILVNKSTLEDGPANFVFYDIAGLLFPERFPALQPRP